MITGVIASAYSWIHGVHLLVPWDVSRVFVGQNGHYFASFLFDSMLAWVVACRQNADWQVD